MNFFKKLFTKDPPVQHTYPIGHWIIHVPTYIDSIQLGKITHYSFNKPVTKDFIAFGYTIPFSPIALETILSLTPIQRLALFSQMPLPKHETDYTLNYNQPLANTISPELTSEANDWYETLPINQIEIIQERTPPTPKKRIYRKRKIAQPKRSPILNQDPSL